MFAAAAVIRDVPHHDRPTRLLIISKGKKAKPKRSPHGMIRASGYFQIVVTANCYARVPVVAIEAAASAIAVDVAPNVRNDEIVLDPQSNAIAVHDHVDNCYRGVLIFLFGSFLNRSARPTRNILNLAPAFPPNGGGRRSASRAWTISFSIC